MGDRKSFKRKEVEVGGAPYIITALKRNSSEVVCDASGTGAIALLLTDQGLHHKLVLKVANLVAVEGLTFLNSCYGAPAL